MATKILQPFKSLTVPLQNTNLIEASAGTGKTYSIAILVLRLIVERNIELKEVLMVTFTKAAVAELETRIRRFVRDGYNHIIGQPASDSNIQEVLESAVKAFGKDEVIVRLKRARQQLDETSIFTIHGFCQLSLSEFAFETGQLFDSDVIEDETAIIEKVVNEYWRKEITTIETSLLQILRDNGLSRAEIIDVVKKALSGKKFVCNESFVYDNGLEKLKKAEEKVKKNIQEFNHCFETNGEKENVKNNGNAMKSFGNLLNDAEGFRRTLLLKKGTGYVGKLFSNLLETALFCESAEEELEEIVNEIKYYHYNNAIINTEGEIKRIKKELTQFSFDDLITNMHSAINSGTSDQLITNLQNKYKAAFIDEFQDTDKYQYEIFNTIFQNSTVFYIGDPKQSIYRFRGADIETYLKAADQVKAAYTMKHNFRSTPNLIKALNSFFTNVNDPFFDSRIKYEVVDNGLNLKELTQEGTSCIPLVLYSESSKPKIAQQTSYKVLELLTQDYKIKGRSVKPSDVGILVRSKTEGNTIKEALARLNIPAITIDDTTIWNTKETEIIKYVLTAIVDPNKPNINRALFNYLVSKTKDELINPNNNTDLENFRELNKTLNENGVFTTLKQFIEMYNVSEYVFKCNPDNGDRIISNLLQVIEILHKKEVQTELSPSELLIWFGKMIADGSNDKSDDYTLRLESDEDAVQIVTIHKSKGLAYNIVIAPHLDLHAEPKYSPIEYKNPDSDKYCFSYYKTEEEKAWYGLQTEQENRRLIYVALTRAVYQCIIYQNTSTKGGNGSIKKFTDAVSSNEFIALGNSLPEPTTKYIQNKEEIHKIPKVFDCKINNNWQISSFSNLGNKHAFVTGGEKIILDDYSQFVFEDMPRGTIPGNFLHQLFEYADFKVDEHTEVIKKADSRYPIVKNDNIQNYQDLINHTLKAKLGNELNFRLSDIGNESKLNELEFYFSTHDFNMQELTKLIPDLKSDKYSSIEGLMHGFIDLVFRYQGKYYILDWKSNYLGSSLKDYTSDKLEQAIRANNYHLQYLIYTVALTRYLEQQILDFNYSEHFGGVIYIFLRGCRSGQDSGVFFDKPEQGLIKKMDAVFGKISTAT